jgi:hypothetical protein
MEQVVVHEEKAFSALGVAEPAVISAGGIRIPIPWADSLNRAIGLETTAQLGVSSRTEVFHPEPGSVLEFSLESCRSGDARGRFLLTLHDADDGSRLVAFPYDAAEFPSGAAGLERHSIGFGGFAGRDMYLEITSTDVPIESHLELLHRYSLREAADEDETEKQAVAGKTDLYKPMLGQNSPNPFNPSTEIHFALKRAGRITLAVHDMLGRRVLTLADRDYEAGKHSIRFDGTGLPSGVYLYTLEHNGYTLTKRMHLVK